MTTWHEQNIAAWRQLIKPAAVAGRRPRWLELGSYEGSGAAWVVEELGFDVTCVDTWNDQQVEATFDRVALDLAGRITKVKGRSREVLPTLAGPFDCVYIDADHDASAVLTDAVLSWPLVPVGGYLIFDDYEWSHPNHKVGQLAPRVGIDAFVRAFLLQVVVLHKGGQVILQKRRPNNHAR